VVQTIDLLPTLLSALGIPRPARVRGRDLGPVLTRTAGPDDPGTALAETDDYALLASGPDRLVCERRAAACALYQPKTDLREQTDTSAQNPSRVAALRGALRAAERDHGRYEGAAGPVWPEALRRGMQGEADAAPDVASLLDDADVVMRRKAAEVCFDLRAPVTRPEVERALARDEDPQVRRWSALALVRLGGPVSPLVEALLRDPDPAWRHAAALALGERGDRRACDELAAWWTEVAPADMENRADGEPGQLTTDLASARQLLEATVEARCRSAVPGLLRAVDDVRARPYVADALGTLGDTRARPVLSALLRRESNVTNRAHEAQALQALGGSDAIDRAASPK
jgi:hypothetical protein